MDKKNNAKLQLARVLEIPSLWYIYPSSGKKSDDSLHSPKALPLGWVINGFQPSPIRRRLQTIVGRTRSVQYEVKASLSPAIRRVE
jgi:hypothetical protein